MNDVVERVARAIAPSCGACKWACPKREPGPEPTIPPQGLFARVFGEDRWGRYLRESDHRWWRVLKEEFDTEIWCHRFPTVVSKERSDRCGEFSAALADASLDGETN